MGTEVGIPIGGTAPDIAYRARGRSLTSGRGLAELPEGRQVAV